MKNQTKTCEVCGDKNVETKFIEEVNTCNQCVSEEAWGCGEQHMKDMCKVDREIICTECAIVSAEGLRE